MTNEEIYRNFRIEVINKQNSIQKAYHFNVLDAQCGHIVENSHTNILMQLLQYKNRYGYVFLEDFISLAGFDIHIEKNDVVQFNTEYFNKVNLDKESVKEKLGRIDGLIYCKSKFAIIIENKINGAGNQQRQLCRYVDAIINNLSVNMEQVWIVFLTREGIEDPDEDSVQYLRKKNLLDEKNADDDNNITGPHYFPCTYRDNILGWLKDSVLPIVMHKEESLYSGLVQYIDFLEGMLGKRDSALIIELKQWFKEQEFWNNQVGIIAQNTFLHGLYNSVIDKRSKQTKNKNYDDEIKIIDLFRTIIDEILEEPMMNFLDVTKNYFVQNKLISLDSYHLNHHPGYYYITIRDKRWPKGVYFGWARLGINMLIDNDSKKTNYTLCVNLNKCECNNNELKMALKNSGFEYDKQLAEYRKSINVEKRFLQLTEAEQKEFLECFYKKNFKEIVKNYQKMYKDSL